MILLVNPPMSDPDGPYPAIAYLAGYLKTIDRPCTLADLSFDVARHLLSREGIAAVTAELEQRVTAGRVRPSARTLQFLRQADRYADTVDTARAALQGRDVGAVARAARPGYFPESPDSLRRHAGATALALETYQRRLGPLTPAQRARVVAVPDPERVLLGPDGSPGEARYRASLMISEVVAVVTEGIDPDFSLHRYAARLVDPGRPIDDVLARLESEPTLIEQWIDMAAVSAWRRAGAGALGVSVPFAGSVYGALRVATAVRAHAPGVPIAMGGGWVNTSLRQINDPRLFDLVDAVMLDDGERPLASWLDALDGHGGSDRLCRTFVREQGTVAFRSRVDVGDVLPAQTGTPTYAGLPVAEYLPYAPHLQAAWYPWRGRWNKLTLAHGCYWRKCAFCDVSLDYVHRYVPVDLDTTIARMRAQIVETGDTGFHFVDEAMPPALLQRLASRLRSERLSVTWWGNVRFDPQLARMAHDLADAGCVRLTGGLEVASDRLLTLMAKGISLRQVAEVTGALSRAGIQIHAYLIFGFPTQTAQETVDALEYVRQLFEARCISSVAWHQFTLTAHSPVAERPDDFGIELLPLDPQSFNQYELPYREINGLDHRRFAQGLHRAVETYMHGHGFRVPLPDWFEFAVPGPTLAADFVSRILETTTTDDTDSTRRVHR